jgi:hypothetical protein
VLVGLDNLTRLDRRPRLNTSKTLSPESRVISGVISSNGCDILLDGSIRSRIEEAKGSKLIHCSKGRNVSFLLSKEANLFLLDIHERLPELGELNHLRGNFRFDPGFLGIDILNVCNVDASNASNTTSSTVRTLLGNSKVDDTIIGNTSATSAGMGSHLSRDTDAVTESSAVAGSTVGIGRRASGSARTRTLGFRHDG